MQGRAGRPVPLNIPVPLNKYLFDPRGRKHSVNSPRTPSSARRKSIFPTLGTKLFRPTSPRERMRDIMHTAPSLRGEEDLLFLDTELKDTEFFSRFSYSTRTKIYASLEIVSYEPKDVVFLQGDIGRHFYIVITGLVAVYVTQTSRTDGDDGNAEEAAELAKKAALALKEEGAIDALEHIDVVQSTFNKEKIEVSRLTRGMSFGELALMHEVPRQATVVAIEPTELLSLSKADYDRIIKETELDHAQELLDFITKVPCFGLVDRYSFGSLIPFFKELRFTRGLPILKQGTPVPALEDFAFFLVLKGEVMAVYEMPIPHPQESYFRDKISLHKHYSFLFDSKLLAPSKRNVELGVLGPFQSFGEFALATNSRQPLSIVSLGCTVLAMTRHNYFKKLRLETSGLIEKHSIMRHKIWYERVVKAHQTMLASEQRVGQSELSRATLIDRMPTWDFELKGDSIISQAEHDRLRTLERYERARREIEASKAKAPSPRKHHHRSHSRTHRGESGSPSRSGGDDAESAGHEPQSTLFLTGVDSVFGNDNNKQQQQQQRGKGQKPRRKRKKSVKTFKDLLQDDSVVFFLTGASIGQPPPPHSGPDGTMSPRELRAAQNRHKHELNKFQLPRPPTSERQRTGGISSPQTNPHYQQQQATPRPQTTATPQSARMAATPPPQPRSSGGSARRTHAMRSHYVPGSYEIDESLRLLQEMRSHLPIVYSPTSRRSESQMTRDVSSFLFSPEPEPVQQVTKPRRRRKKRKDKNLTDGSVWKTLDQTMEKVVEGSDGDTASETEREREIQRLTHNKHWSDFFPNDPGSDIDDYA